MAFEKQEIENLLLSILSSINDLNNEDEKIEENVKRYIFVNIGIKIAYFSYIIIKVKR